MGIILAEDESTLILRVLTHIPSFPYTSGFQTVSHNLLTDCKCNLMGPDQHFKKWNRKDQKISEWNEHGRVIILGNLCFRCLWVYTHWVVIQNLCSKKVWKKDFLYYIILPLEYLFFFFLMRVKAKVKDKHSNSKHWPWSKELERYGYCKV